MDAFKLSHSLSLSLSLVASAPRHAYTRTRIIPLPEKENTTRIASHWHLWPDIYCVTLNPTPVSKLSRRTPRRTDVGHYSGLETLVHGAFRAFSICM